MRGRLDLSFLLTSGDLSDLEVVCSGRNGNEQSFRVHRVIIFSQCRKLRDLALEAPVYQKDGQNDVVELDLDPDVFESVLEFLYSGVHQTECKAAEGRISDDFIDHDLDDDFHPLFQALRVCRMADELELDDLSAEAAAALCSLAPSFTSHVDFPAFVSELYGFFSDRVCFPYRLASIPRLVTETLLRDSRFAERIEPVMRRHSALALDVVDGMKDELADAQKDLRKAREKVAEMQRRERLKFGSTDPAGRRRRKREREDSGGENLVYQRRRVV